jgi:hypothetical protein
MISIMHGDYLKTFSLFCYILFSFLHSHSLSLSPSSIFLLPSSSFSFLMSYFIVVKFYLKSSLFSDRELYCPANINRYVRRKYRLHLQPWRWRRHVLLKLVHFHWTTRCYISENRILQNHHCENFKSCNIHYSPSFYFLFLLLYSSFVFLNLWHVILPFLHNVLYPGTVAADPCCPAESADKGCTLNEAPFFFFFAELTSPRGLHSPAGNITASHTLLLRHILITFSYMRVDTHVLI